MNKARYSLSGWLSRGTDGVDRKRSAIDAAEASFASFAARLAAGRDALGDYLKGFEARETMRRAMPGLPIYVRLDGSSFSSFTRKMARPYDVRLSRVMIEVTKILVEQSGAVLGYTQSDEISLGFWYPDPKTEPFLGGRFQKLATELAGRASSEFTYLGMKAFPEAVDRQRPFFDGRALDVPGLEVLAGFFVWRELDATKNAVSMAARAYFPHKALDRKSAPEMQEMLFAGPGINFNDYPAFFRRGTYVRRVTEERVLSEAELARIPAARRPTGPVTRSRIAELALPPTTRVANPIGVLFGGEEPVPFQAPDPTAPLAA